MTISLPTPGHPLPLSIDTPIRDAENKSSLARSMEQFTEHLTEAFQKYCLNHREYSFKKICFNEATGSVIAVRQYNDTMLLQNLDPVLLLYRIEEQNNVDLRTITEMLEDSFFSIKDSNFTKDYNFTNEYKELFIRDRSSFEVNGFALYGTLWERNFSEKIIEKLQCIVTRIKSSLKRCIFIVKNDERTILVQYCCLNQPVTILQYRSEESAKVSLLFFKNLAEKFPEESKLLEQLVVLQDHVEDPRLNLLSFYDTSFDTSIVKSFNQALKEIKFYGIAIKSFFFRVSNGHKKFFLLDSNDNKICIFEYSKEGQLSEEQRIKCLCKGIKKKFPAYNWKSFYEVIINVESKYIESQFQKDAADLESFVAGVNQFCNNEFLIEFTAGQSCIISLNNSNPKIEDKTVWNTKIPIFNKEQLKSVFAKQLLDRTDLKYYANILKTEGPLKKYFNSDERKSIRARLRGWLTWK